MGHLLAADRKVQKQKISSMLFCKAEAGLPQGHEHIWSTFQVIKQYFEYLKDILNALQLGHVAPTQPFLGDYFSLALTCLKLTCMKDGPASLFLLILKNACL